MRLTLAPLSHTELQKLYLSEGVLPIGRNDEPFASYPQSLSGRLSRRHARVFLEKDTFYISDLGSKNGTRVNGQEIQADPLPLKPGDHLSFGGELEFVAEISSQGDLSNTQTGMIDLILEPVDLNAGLTRLVINQFPLLIGKASEPFVQFAEIFPQEVLFLSRRHAHLYARDGRVYVEDLGSTNGTYLSSERLTDQPRVLEGGETLAFGGDFFQYRVFFSLHGSTQTGSLATVIADDAERTNVLQRDAPPATSGSPNTQTTSDADSPVPASSHTKGTDRASVAADPGRPQPDNEVRTTAPESLPLDDNCRTTFVSSPTSFLEIFCAESEAQDKDRQGAGTPGKGHPEDVARSKGAKPSKKGRRWYLLPLGLLTIGLIAAVVWLMPKGQEQQLANLIRAGDFEKAAELGNQWMTDLAAVRTLRPLATEAFLKYLVPPWQAAIERHAFKEADEQLAAAATLTSNNTEAGDLLKLMHWVTRLQAYTDAHGAPKGTIQIFKDEREMQAITAAWTEDETKNGRLLELISAQVPTSQTLVNTTYSDVRALQTKSSLYVKVISKLTDNLATALRRSAIVEPEQRDSILDGIVDELNTFRSKYPKVAGVQAIVEDLSDYRALLKWVDNRQLTMILNAIEAGEPRTPPFQQHRKWFMKHQLPSEAFLEGFGTAVDAWAAGREIEAIGTLRKLARNDWHSVAKTLLAHDEAIAQAHQELLTDKGKKDFRARLLAFYRLLDGADGYFAQSFATEFDTVKREITGEADASFAAATQQWERFRDDGGIDGGMRIGRKTTAAFKRQAARLSDALRLAEGAAQGYTSVGVEPSASQKNTYKEIRLEVKRQRGWLKDLELVVGPHITREKLALLPELTTGGEPK